MRLSRFDRRLSIIFVGAALACHDGSAAPHTTTTFDARHALAKVEPIAVVFDQPIFKSFESTLNFFESFFRSALPASSMIALQRRSFDLRLTRYVAPIARISATTIPDGDKGKTFVFSETAGTYVVDPAATGAPTTGVRFVLYTWDELTEQPASPLMRLGYVDIAPAEGANGSTDQTELVIIRDAPFLPIADFIVSHHTESGVSAFAIAGSATDGVTEDLISVDGSLSGGPGQHHLVFNTMLSTSPVTTSATEHVISDQATASESGQLQLSYENHTLTGQSNETGTEITFDGNVYARILFPQSVGDGTRYVKPDGTPLSQQEVNDLLALLDRVVGANFMWVSLAFP
ncbi:MAG TPA: hypothetical protein VJN70_17730 [Gemmatimonadaceae bacterium]|nr:hypothetical protein [Gemmatimonadaceae bacterium]